MKAFHFGLQSVLDWRRAQLEAEQLHSRALAQRMQELENRRTMLLAERTESDHYILRAATLESQELSSAAAFRARMEKREAALRVERTVAESALDAHRVKLIDAQRRLRLLEQLREKRLASWVAEADREQENFAGEAFLARWSTKAALFRHSPPRS